jgi:hypothetical protein
MRKLSLALLLAGSVFLYAGCPENTGGAKSPPAAPPAPTAPTTPDATKPPETKPPETKPPETKPEAPKATSDVNPMYDSAQVGETYVVKMNMGMEMTTKHVIKAKDADNLTVELVTEIPNVPAQPGVEQKYPIKMPKAEGTAAAPANAPKAIKSETLTISGVKFACDVYETDVAGKKVQSWTCKDHYPGTVKMVDDTGKTTMELVEIKK